VLYFIRQYTNVEVNEGGVIYMSGTVYVVGNFKGGVGKTKTVTMLAYESARYLKERTLVIDMDPQGNATRVLAKTGNLDAIDKSITEGFQNGDLETEVITVMENLDIIPANTSFRNLPKMLFNMFPDDEVAQITYLKKLVAPLKEKYDRIYIDVPPTISDYSDNAMMAADYCIIVLQTQELSLDGAQTYIAYMQFLSENYDAQLQVLGIIPMMLRQGGRVDTKVLDQATEMYGGNVLNTIVNYQERLKVYDVEGIHMHTNMNGKVEMWDAKAHQLFIDVLTELNEHEEYLEKL
jgi:cellulose biosynthesis protein BcsQ